MSDRIEGASGKVSPCAQRYIITAEYGGFGYIEELYLVDENGIEEYTEYAYKILKDKLRKMGVSGKTMTVFLNEVVKDSDGSYVRGKYIRELKREAV